MGLFDLEAYAQDSSTRLDCAALYCVKRMLRAEQNVVEFCPDSPCPQEK